MRTLSQIYEKDKNEIDLTILQHKIIVRLRKEKILKYSDVSFGEKGILKKLVDKGIVEVFNKNQYGLLTEDSFWKLTKE